MTKVVSDKRTVVATTAVYVGKRATVTVTDDLERDTPYQFSIDKLEAQDGSTLPEPYKLDFVTSDGPAVAAVNVDSTGLSLSGTIVLTFDQGLSSGQSITDFVAVTGVPVSIRKSGNQVFIDYSNASVCNGINIKVNPGLISDNGVIQNDAWQFSTRTICYTTFSKIKSLLITSLSKSKVKVFGLSYTI